MMSLTFPSRVLRRLASPRQALASTSRVALQTPSALRFSRSFHATCRHSTEAQAQTSRLNNVQEDKNTNQRRDWASRYDIPEDTETLTEEDLAELDELGKDLDGPGQAVRKFPARRKVRSAIIVRGFSEKISIHDIKQALETYGPLRQLSTYT